MIESNDPEIKIDELIQKIVEQVRKSQLNSQLGDLQSNLDISKLKLSISHIENFLKNAESRSLVRTKWPDKLNIFPFNFSTKLQQFILKVINFLFKDQREVNLNIINSLKESLALNQQLIKEIASLKTQVDKRLDESLIAMDNHIQGVDERLVTVDNRFPELDERLIAMDNHIQGLDDSLNAIDIISTWLTGIQESLDTVNSRVQEIDEQKTILDALDAHIERLNEHLITIDSRIITANTSIQEINERYIRNDGYLKNDLMQQKRLITMFIQEARKRLPEPFSQEQLKTFINEDLHFLDAFYVAFEEKFRGSREDILSRLKVYLPLIEEAKVGTDESPILDVGCGRGEWLELLQDSGYITRGLDINRVMIEQCRIRGLEVIEGDVISYLQSLPDASLGAVTGFHIIEHLAFEVLLKLFTETMRVLKTGGLVIFETPNPDNILVGSNTFYLDPTHRNPLPSSMIAFVAESFGLSKVTCIKLHPDTIQPRLTGSELAERFSDYFYGPQDYALVGFKP
ncbi:methyltransferase domain-containing protein [Nostoc flagelliforme FACHB-838]|uniref:Methyltransferase domain-containing protein n=1 Tax=Nostoc flagelliforme FACHB-838 TaxID=2692904 RepID=A0ABR8DXX8_9NOSO|nr:class I SAM-dependent methyltransferase [Nostoc flagelliforme]MBD2533115.1 methyltransferase domain-containing protein [Nostoc flagelliforme FACHB-838]